MVVYAHFSIGTKALKKFGEKVFYECDTGRIFSSIQLQVKVLIKVPFPCFLKDYRVYYLTIE